MHLTYSSPLPNSQIRAVGTIQKLVSESDGTVRLVIATIGKMASDGAEFTAEIHISANRRSVKDLRLGDLFEVTIGQIDSTADRR